MSNREGTPNLPRTIPVKNKSPAPIQITAEQILREARDLQEPSFHPPKHTITDPTELADHHQRKRKEFEDKIRRGGVLGSKPALVQYAIWEESQKEFKRARSVWERALGDYKNHTIWVKYAEFEMRNGAVNDARNVWDRAVTYLPRVDQLWYKYIHMEEMLGEFALARQVFERWMTWQPDEQAWLSYIRFELRHEDIQRARDIYQRFVQCCPTVAAWIRFANFELKNGEIARSRSVYESAVDKLGGDHEDAEALFVAFAEFEEKCNEIERARCIYQFALDHTPKGLAHDLYSKLIAFEYQYGDPSSIQEAIVAKKRFEYENEVGNNPLSYDSWFEYLLMEESVGDKERIRELYERAIANVPPADEKRYWLRYIYLWIKYALYEELHAHDVQRTRDVYKECLKLIPHQKFSFSKVWIKAAEFEIRQLNLSGARAILGNAIGIAPKDKIFMKYIDIEMQTGNVDRCRILCEKYVEWSPENHCAWIKFAEFERSIMETERARSIYELAIAQPALDKPDELWKAYIDLEIEMAEFDKTRQLYERLLDRSKHLKVWISYAKFEASAMEEVKEPEKLHMLKQECIKNARRVFEEALRYYTTSAFELKEERAMLLDEWFKIESDFGELGDIELVRVKMPKKLKRKRQVEDGHGGYEEYIDYLFPEELQASNLKILEEAYKWKKQVSADEAYDDEGDEDEVNATYDDEVEKEMVN